MFQWGLIIMCPEMSLQECAGHLFRVRLLSEWSSGHVPCISGPVKLCGSKNLNWESILNQGSSAFNDLDGHEAKRIKCFWTNYCDRRTRS